MMFHDKMCSSPFYLLAIFPPRSGLNLRTVGPRSRCRGAGVIGRKRGYVQESPPGGLTPSRTKPTTTRTEDSVEVPLTA